MHIGQYISNILEVGSTSRRLFAAKFSTIRTCLLSQNPYWFYLVQNRRLIEVRGRVFGMEKLGALIGIGDSVTLISVQLFVSV